MLRSSLVGVGVVALICGVVALLARIPPAFIFLFWGAVVVLSIVYERFRYKPLESAAPGPGWTKTEERFIDDETGEAVTVWLQRETGERRYVRG
jgi:membrane protein implicated in regulation of membrane protease activity